MAATLVKLGQSITVGTDPIECQIDIDTASLADKVDLAIHTDASNSGTIKFAVGESPAAGQYAWAANSNTVISGVRNGQFNLWAVGSASGQVFVIT